MTDEGAGAHDLKLERVVSAPVERVWQAVSQRDQLPSWYGPGQGMRIEVLEWDLRVGGTYRVAMHGDEETHTCYGEFRAVEPPRRIAYTWAWEGQPPMDTLVTFELDGDGDETRVTLIHSGFPAEEAREAHRQGWTGSLERLGAAMG